MQYSKTTRKKTPESKNRNDEFPENHQKCFGFFGSDSSRSILEPPEKKGEIITKISVPDRKPPEKKPPESKKNRNDEFPEKPPEMFRIFWLRWFQNPLLEPPEKRGESHHKNICA